MKIIRIILLALIIIGCILLLTQKIWVPRVVGYILSRETPPTIISHDTQVQPDLTLVDGRQCYTYSHDATSDAPYTVQERITITIQGTAVTGIKTGTQNGPDMSNGYSGTLSGTTDGHMMQLLYAYTVEGSRNTEKELYRASKTGIEKLRYPLIEQKGILVPDTTKAYAVISYARIGCTASN